MNRKLVAGIAGLVVALAAVWFFVLRPRHEAPAPAPAAQRDGKIDAKLPAAKADDTPAPRGAAPKWSLDADPEGTLRLEGQVLGPDGRGIAGAQVWLSSVPPRTAKTEGDGTFAFDKLVGRTFSLGASSGELVGGPVIYKLTKTSDPVVIRIAEGAALAVTVSDEQAHPIVGAGVQTADVPQAKTDDHGKALLKPIRPGWVSVEVTAPGYAPSSSFTTVGSAGATGEIALTLHKGAAVSGRVIDETGKPVAKAQISANDGTPWGFGKSGDEIETDAKGQFTFPALAPGSHVLEASDGEHEPISSPPITVTADRAVTGIEIVMKAGATLAGTVVDRDGKPAPFAMVRVAGTGARMWNVAARQVTADQHGAFELRGLHRAKLQARAESEAAASKVVDVDLATKPAIRDLKLALDVSGTIAGTVVDDQGQPVAEIQINAFPDLLGGGNLEGAALAGMSSATTDGAGAFTIHGLPDGPYKLWAGRSLGFDNWGQQGTRAKTGDKAVRIVIPASGGVKGTLVLATGVAPKLATVQVGRHPATPAAAGAFEVKDLQPGTYDLVLHGPEFAELVKHDVKIEPGKTTDLGAITVARGRTLVGRVVDGSGAPVAGAKIKLGEMLFTMAGGDEERTANLEQMAGIRSATSDQDGAFTLIGVPQKATTVMADHPDRGRSVAQPVPEGTDDPPAMTLALRGFGVITGKVTLKGQPQGGITVSESTKGGGAQAVFAQTADDGTFMMAKVPEGAHVINAMQTGLMTMKSTSVTVQVTAGKTTTVAIDIPVGTIALTVQIKAQPGAKVDSAQVFLIRGTASPTTGKDLTQGFFQGGAQGMKFWFGEGKPLPEFDELVAGDYTVCSIPITGDLTDPTFQQRLQENSQTLKVYCKQVKIAASPDKQSVVQELPSMTPLPSPKT